MMIGRSNIMYNEFYLISGLQCMMFVSLSDRDRDSHCRSREDITLLGDP